MLNIRTSLPAKSWMINNIMKYLIFAVALLVASNASTCFIYDCATIPAATPAPCIAVGTTNINVNACPTGYSCDYAAAGYLTNLKLTPQTCTQNPAPPNPVPAVTDIAPGDTCITANQDTCNKGTCTNGVCVSTTKPAGACANSKECPLGYYCDSSATKTCLAVVAPQGACTMQASITTFSEQCGYHAYCVNSKCTLPYSLANGNTNIPTNTVGIQVSAVSRLCTSGYATPDATSGNFFCAPAPVNTLTGGQATAA